MPILVYTEAKSFDEYLKSLARPMKYRWKRLLRKFPDWTYERWEFEKETAQKLIDIWESQLHAGGYRTYFHWDDICKNDLDKFMFFAVKDKKGSVIAIHPTLFYDENGDWITVKDVEARLPAKREPDANGNMWFTNCLCPIYDKSIEPDTAGFMWFNFIKYAIEHHFPMLDFAGGDDWREPLRNPSPNQRAKWKFVPRWVKNDPDGQPDYWRERNRIFIKAEVAQ